MTGGICNSFKRDLLAGLHQPGDEYRMALYTSDAPIDPDTVIYIGAGEVAGKGYEPGGRVIHFQGPTLMDGIARLGWSSPPVWENSTITARAALIYNTSRDNRAVAVMDFGRDYSSTNGPFSVGCPPSDSEAALIRIR